MRTRNAVPRMRYANCLSMIALFGLLISVSAAAVPQNRSSDATSDPERISTSESFSSSTDQPAADASAGDGSAAVVPSLGAAGGAAQSDHGYGSFGARNRGWMNHATFEIGGGFNAPTRSTSEAVSWGGNITAGAGYSFTPHFSLLTEYQFIADKLPGAIISQTGAQGGSAHIWSVTLAPVIDLFPRQKNDLYITGGGGFYRKVTSFTDPAYAQYCTYFYCGVVGYNQVVGHFSSNQGGWNVGVGYTRKIGGGFGSDSKAKLFAEVRYLDIDTPAVDSEPNGLGRTTFGAGTKLVPVTFGVRF